MPASDKKSLRQKSSKHKACHHHIKETVHHCELILSHWCRLLNLHDRKISHISSTICRTIISFRGPGDIVAFSSNSTLSSFEIYTAINVRTLTLSSLSTQIRTNLHLYMFYRTTYSAMSTTTTPSQHANCRISCASNRFTATCDSTTMRTATTRQKSCVRGTRHYAPRWITAMCTESAAAILTKDCLANPRITSTCSTSTR